MIPLEISYSPAAETKRVSYTLRDYRWFVENGYRPLLPESIKTCLENGEDVPAADIRPAIESEYQEQMYREKAEELAAVWEEQAAEFFEKLEALGRPLAQAYRLSLTQYGTGGSYGYPDAIQLNVNNNPQKGILYVTFHEIVHLTIQDLIERYHIDHWTKERVVDLIMNRFFPEQEQFQRPPEHANQVREIFEREFPDIEKVLKEVSEITS
jgi:hypothetical protein